jgi:multimeric flavodoxin WrbA
MSKKVLGILGSPCKDGNTAILLDAVLEGARDAGAKVERIDIRDLRIDACDGCRNCDGTGTCSRTGDDMGVVYKKIREADALVLASPIFFMGVTAQLKALIDRCQCFWIERFVLGRRPYEGKRHPKGLFVSAAGSQKPEVFDPAIHCVKALFIALDYSYAGEILLPNTDSPDIATRRKPIAQRAREAGKQLIT